MISQGCWATTSATNHQTIKNQTTGEQQDPFILIHVISKEQSEMQAKVKMRTPTAANSSGTSYVQNMVKPYTQARPLHSATP